MNKNLFRDPDYIDKKFPPDMIPITIMSNDQKMFGVIYTAQGIGPHPTMLLLHGFPGNERNFDLAHALRRAGWNVLIFHYRGTWGSEGDFSFENCLIDIKAAFDFLREDKAVEKYRIDRKRLVIGGNSVGGFAALLSVAQGLDFKGCISMSSYDLGLMGDLIQKDELAMKSLRIMFEECIEPTKGASLDDLIDEIIKNSKEWNLSNYGASLSRKNLLLFAGNRDDVGPPEVQFYPLIEAIKAYDPQNLEYHLLDSDHGFQDKRITISEIIEEWLESKIK